MLFVHETLLKDVFPGTVLITDLDDTLASQDPQFSVRVDNHDVDAQGFAGLEVVVTFTDRVGCEKDHICTVYPVLQADVPDIEDLLPLLGEMKPSNFNHGLGVIPEAFRRRGILQIELTDEGTMDVNYFVTLPYSENVISIPLFFTGDIQS